MSLNVTIVDEQTGEQQTARVEDGDYLIVTASPCYVAHTQVFGVIGQTHQITVKDRLPLPPKPLEPRS